MSDEILGVIVFLVNLATWAFIAWVTREDK